MSGVLGVWAPGHDVAQLAFCGAYAVQHRGRDAAGIAVMNGDAIFVCRGDGLVSEACDEDSLRVQQGHIAVAHTQHRPPHGSGHLPQPRIRGGEHGAVAVGLDGGLVSRDGSRRSTSRTATTTDDADFVAGLLTQHRVARVEQRALNTLVQLRGAYCLVWMDEGTLLAARDPQGVWPLALGSLGDGWVVASESAALATMGARFVRDVEPGELIAIDEDGLRSYRFADLQRSSCVLEHVVLARSDAMLDGRSAHQTRLKMGRRLARESSAIADLVVAVPDSGSAAAAGFAAESGIPLAEGFVANAYVAREVGVRALEANDALPYLKLQPLAHVVRGQRIALVDASLSEPELKAAVNMLRIAGAAEVHVRIAGPDVRSHCLYGAENNMQGSSTDVSTDGQAAWRLGADSFSSITLEGVVTSIELPVGDLCTACLSQQPAKP